MKLLLIDGHALLYRAFFGYPQSLTLNDGRLVNAAYGFTRLMLGAINELKPSHLAVSFDVGKTFRHEAYEGYKAHREKMPEELKYQEPMIDEILAALNIPIYTTDGFEADDVIGTLARQAEEKLRSYEVKELHSEDGVLIMTGDKDIWQLVSDKIQVYSPPMYKRPSRIIDRGQVKELMGVFPEQVPDYKGLAGDNSDNIIGIPGVGPKTAVQLLNSFGTIENLYLTIEANSPLPIDPISNKPINISSAMMKKLLDGKKSAMESKKLATIVTEVPIKLNLEHCEVKRYDRGLAERVLIKYSFKSLINVLPDDNFEDEIQEALF